MRVCHLVIRLQDVNSGIVNSGGVFDERDNVGAVNAGTDEGAIENEGEESLVEGNIGVAQAEETLSKLLSVKVSNQYQKQLPKVGGPVEEHSDEPVLHGNRIEVLLTTSKDGYELSHVVGRRKREASSLKETPIAVDALDGVASSEHDRENLEAKGDYLCGQLLALALWHLAFGLECLHRGKKKGIQAQGMMMEPAQTSQCRLVSLQHCSGPSP